jgi:hypothetical protein
MPRLSGSAAPPALQPRAGSSSAAAAGAAPALAAAPVAAASATTSAAPLPAAAAAPARSSTSIVAPTQAQATAQARPGPAAAALPEEVPPPPDHPFLREPRLYRQPDGSLSARKPPPEPYTVVRARCHSCLLGDAFCFCSRVSVC